MLRTLAGDVAQIVHTIDFGKLADDEAEIHALCAAVYDFIFLETGYILGDDEWNEGIAMDKNVLKRGEVSGSVRAAVKAALTFRSLATRDDAMSPRLVALARQLIELHGKFAPSMPCIVMQEVRGISPPDPPEPLPPTEPPLPAGP